MNEHTLQKALWWACGSITWEPSEKQYDADGPQALAQSSGVLNHALLFMNKVNILFIILYGLIHIHFLCDYPYYHENCIFERKLAIICSCKPWSKGSSVLPPGEWPGCWHGHSPTILSWKAVTGEWHHQKVWHLMGKCLDPVARLSWGILSNSWGAWGLFLPTM